MWSHTDDIIAWIIRKKSFFGFRNDVYLANIYIVPEGSTYLKQNEFNLLYEDILKVPDNSEVLLCGDYNARTGVKLEFDVHFSGCNGDLNDLLPPDDGGVYYMIENMHRNGRLARKSKDKEVDNKHGTQLLDLCKSTGMLILNGRMGRDKGIGEFTRDDTTGRSVVDYMIGTPRLFDLVQHFQVLDKFPESDHRAISLSMTSSRCIANNDKLPSLNWEPHTRYIWTRDKLSELTVTMIDGVSDSYKQACLQSVADLCDVDSVARNFDNYISQACRRTFSHDARTCRKHTKDPAWYDAECRRKRVHAITAGECISNDEDREKQITACQQYRACKQRKKRAYEKRCIENIKSAYFSNRGDMWKILNHISKNINEINEPNDDDFYYHFNVLSSPQHKDCFHAEYEANAIEFIRKYEQGINTNCDNPIIEEIMNSNFTYEEIVSAIDFLKCNKSPGIDDISAEFIKVCKNTLADCILNALNYIIESQDFLQTWASGLRSAVYKGGKRTLVDNFRGITILPIMEKIFEIVVYKRFSFIEEAFNEIDRYNGGFLRGSRTSDNMFILNGLIERQLVLGRSLFVCFVDFSKAFDIINRNIWFYKLLNGGWRGRVIDTLRSLYDKSQFRVKRNGKLSPVINNYSGVNQGRISSGLLFRKYMADLGDYLNAEYGVVISDEIIVHLLWADDLILFSDTEKGLQNLLNGLHKFCSNNQMIVNETKTKVMCFGKTVKPELYFNNNEIQHVEQYKYLGNIIRLLDR